MSKPENILVVISSHGNGYLRVSIPIIDNLIKEGFTPVLASDGTAIEAIHREFPFLEAIRLPAYTTKYLNSTKKKRFVNTLNAIALIWYFWIERKVITKICSNYDIQGIISVGRFGARKKSIPSILVTHQLNLLKETSTELTNYIHSQFLKSFDQCWVPDIYKAPNLSGFIGHQQLSKLNLRYMGIISRLRLIDTKPIYNLTVLITAKEPFRTKMEEKIKRELQTFQGSVQFIQGLYEQEAISHKDGNITIHTNVSSRSLQQVLNQSEWVITNADYYTVTEIARLEKKVFFIPDDSDSEQLYLAKRIQTHKQAPSCLLDEFSLEQLSRINMHKGFQGFYTEPNWESLFKSQFDGKIRSKGQK